MQLNQSNTLASRGPNILDNNLFICFQLNSNNSKRKLTLPSLGSQLPPRSRRFWQSRSCSLPPDSMCQSPAWWRGWGLLVVATAWRCCWDKQCEGSQGTGSAWLHWLLCVWIGGRNLKKKRKRKTRTFKGAQCDWIYL